MLTRAEVEATLLLMGYRNYVGLRWTFLRCGVPTLHIMEDRVRVWPDDALWHNACERCIDVVFAREGVTMEIFIEGLLEAAQRQGFSL